MVCTFCGKIHDDSDNFCPQCGKSPKRKAPYSEFEIGRIAALDTIKRDVLSWFLGGAAVVGLLAYFGVNELIKDKVGDAVNTHIETIQKTIDAASSRAVESGIKADIETKKVESTLTDLDMKKSQLEKSLDDATRKEHELNGSINELNDAKRRIITATSDLEQRENALKKIIDTENLTKIFAELRSDHYRVRTLKARVRLVFLQTPAAPAIQFVLNTISLSKAVANKMPREENYVVQFYPTGNLTGLNDQLAATQGALVTYEMYAPFEQDIANHSMRNLGGIDRVSLQFGPVFPRPPDSAESALANIERLIAVTKNLTVEVELNGTLLNRHEFSRQDLQLPTDRSSLIFSGMAKFDVSKSVSGSYGDVKALYVSRVSALTE